MPQQKSMTSSLPRGWKDHIKSAVLHVISLANYAVTQTQGRALSGKNAKARRAAEIDRLQQEVALLQKEMRMKDARWARVPGLRRPHYTPTERMAILELRAAHGWTTQQTANAFHVSAATIATWLSRIDEQGPSALVQIHEPVNKFPNFVRYLVQRLKVLCPRLGKVKIAQVLCRAGLHLSATTVGRMLKETPAPKPTEVLVEENKTVTAKRPNHVWHIDLTVVPTSSGLWTAWMPFAVPQSWPFCWWVAVTMDHYSRRVVGFALFTGSPQSREINALLGRAIARAGARPKYLTCDKGPQFWCAGFLA